MTTKKVLPIGSSSFRSIRQDDFLYIDKTEIIYSLLKESRYLFLARPRRFGKSLLLSTLKEIFLGNKELFTGLWIEKSDYTWPVHPVIYIDFNVVNNASPEKLEEGLCYLLDDVAESYSVDVTARRSSSDKLNKLVQTLSARGPVVILIDEYDQPVTSHLDNVEIAHKNSAVLQSFYRTIKSLSEYTRFLFITGVGKFVKTSMFSGFNSLKDLSFYPSASTLLGYTQEEIERFLMEYVDEVAVARSLTREGVFAEMRTWYNGYRFSASPERVYNPWSMFNYLDSKRRDNFWFASGTPTFLIALLKKNKDYSLSSLKGYWATVDMLDVFDVDALSLPALLYQTGYLTISDYSRERERYQLSYPNKEVEISLASHLLGSLLSADAYRVSPLVGELGGALHAGNVEEFALHMQTLLAGISYNLHVQKEAYYHSILYTVGLLLGADVACEVRTSLGIIDMVITLPQTIFVIECKFDKTAAEALAQIQEKRYGEKYQSSGKKVILVGMNFGFKDKRVLVESISTHQE